MRIRLSVLTALALVAACEHRGEEERTRETAAAALRGVLLYPGSTPITVSAGADAGQLVLTTPATLQDVATWYRRTLTLNGWELRSDAVLGDGGISISADRGRQPLWIILRPNVGGPGTTYTLIGAISRTDTAAQRSGSSMSSKRIQRR